MPGYFIILTRLSVWGILQNKGIIIKPLSVSRPFRIFFFMLGAFIWAATLLNESPECCWITPAQRPFDWLSLTVLWNVCLDGSSRAEGTLCWRGPTHKLQAHTQNTHTHTLTVCLLLSHSHSHGLLTLRWKWKEGGAQGTLCSRKGSHTCDLQHYNTSVTASPIQCMACTIVLLDHRSILFLPRSRL